MLLFPALFSIAILAHGNTTAFDLSEVAPGIFVHQGKLLETNVPGHDDIANIGFIVGAKCVAVIDTGGSVRTGAALRAALREHTSKPICYVINTHEHFDHVLGNFAFVADKPVFVGSANLPASLTRSRDLFLREFAGDFVAPASAQQIIAPSRTVKIGENMQLDLGDRKLRLHAWPKAHTDSDLSVLDEKTATLWSGDLIVRERIPSLDGSIKGWLGVLDQLTHTQAKLLIPGHGAPTHDLSAAIVPVRRYLQAIVDGVRAAIAKGESMQTAIDHVAAGEKSNWQLWDEEHPHNVDRAYQELEWE